MAIHKANIAKNGWATVVDYRHILESYAFKNKSVQDETVLAPNGNGVLPTACYLPSNSKWVTTDRLPKL